MAKERAFGVHFDIHLHTGNKNYGSKFDPNEVEEFVSKVKPDFLQCDTKGHYGLSSYPTEVGTRGDLAPGIDVLRTWREITAKHGVDLYAHHSGIVDLEMAKKHPEWAVLDENGNTIGGDTPVWPFRDVSMFSPYVDEVLVPQLVEIAQKYDVDGCWVDGDSWAVKVDYSKYAVEAYMKKYGKYPPKPDSEDYHDYVEFTRQGFRDYVIHYAEEVHKQCPDFKVASSWMYSHLMPEKPNSAIDYVSGDFYGTDSVNSGRFAGRCMSNHGIPWDIMAWNGAQITGCPFGVNRDHAKEATQLCQEAAVALSLGGGFQWCQWQKDGGIPKWQVARAVEVAKFYRARQEFCYGAKHVPQAAVIYSAQAYYSTNQAKFWAENHIGYSVYSTLLATLDNQYSTEVLVTYQALERDLSQYGLLIIPDYPTLEPELKEKLVKYVEEGGSLVVTGVDNTCLFKEQLGVEILESTKEAEYIYIEKEGKVPASILTRHNVIRFTEESGNEAILPQADGFVPATVRRYGKGLIAGVYFSILEYYRLKSAAMRNFFGEVLSRVYLEPSVKVTGSHLIDVSLMKKDEKLCLNLINMGGDSQSMLVKTFDEIPPLCDIKVEIAYDSEPKSIFIEPEHIVPKYSYENGKIKLVVDRLDLHSIVTIS